MDNRKYNIYFHTHTISGIIICAVLYVIFFAGSFAFFKSDISAWQKNRSFVAEKKGVHKDYNQLIDSLSKERNMLGRDLDFYIQHTGVGAYVSVSPSHDSTVKPKPQKKADAKKGGRRGRGGDGDGLYITYDFVQKQNSDYVKDYDMGEFLYRLHFLAQLNVVPLRLGSPFGYTLAGLVAFLFLFALITGLMLHWNKIVSNFFTFRPWAKWKTVYTDMHTVLGVIQFPFQFIYAVTGIVLIVNTVLMVPYAKVLYKGDTDKLYKALDYSDSAVFQYSYKPLTTTFDLNRFVAEVEHKWEGNELTLISVRNYGDENMHVLVRAKPDAGTGYAGLGKITYRVRDAKVLYEQLPKQGTYVNGVRQLLYHLHFGDFGGRPLRVIYFVLGVMGCVVILSGIMIWLVARDKNNIPKHKRVFNFWTANVFMAACLPLLPVTAFTLIMLLFVKNPDQTTIYHLFFYSWLVTGVYFIIRRNISVTTMQTTILSAIACFMLPLLDGIVRNNWFWNTFSRQAWDILFIDLLFLSLAVISAIAVVKIRQRQKVVTVE